MQNKLGDVARLFLEHVRKVRRQSILRDAHVEAVREAGAAESVQRFHPTRPVLRERLATAAVNLECCAPSVRSADFESSREDDAIRLVLHSVEHQAFRGDAIDAASQGIHQRDVGAIEGRQKFVVEGRTFTKLTIPGLQRLCRLLILDERIDPPADLIHLFEIRDLHQTHHLCRRLLGIFLADEKAAEIADDVGPSVVDEVHILVAARDQDVEIFHPLLLPTRAQCLHPLRIGWTVAALVD